MKGHDLGTAERYTNGTRTIFRAECACGMPIYGRYLWHIWQFHQDEHLPTVRAQSMRHHPSRRDET